MSLIEEAAALAIEATTQSRSITPPGQTPGLIMGTVTGDPGSLDSVLNQHVQVTPDGASGSVTAMVPTEMMETLCMYYVTGNGAMNDTNPAVGARVLMAKIGNRYIITNVISGGWTAQPHWLASTTGNVLPNASWTSLGTWASPGNYGGHKSVFFVGYTNPEVVCSVAGYYDVEFNVQFANNSTGRRIARIQITYAAGGTDVPQQTEPAPAGGYASFSLGCTVFLNPGDKIDFQAYQSSGASMTLGFTNTAQVSRRERSPWE